MLNKAIRILNFDDSVIKQTKLLSKYSSEVVNLKDIGPSARLWLPSSDADTIKARIAGTMKNSVTFLGSGDFHQVASVLIRSFEEPISVIDFDFHPDWTVVGPRLGCGAWVTDILRKENVLKCVILGVSSDDLSAFSLQTGNFKALEKDRLEIYPYSHHPSKVFFRNVPDNISMKVKPGIFYRTICWNELNSKNLEEFFLHVIKRLPTEKVYISIDKDCLKKEYALTNWEEGRMELEELLSMLKMIKDNLDIIGADITGEYSDINVKGFIKDAISRLDHPKDYSAKGVDGAVVTAVNEEANLRILEALN